MERSVRRMVVEGRRDNLLVKLHPDVAMYVLEQERELVQRLQKAAAFSLELSGRSASQARRIQAGGEGSGQGRHPAVRGRVSGLTSTFGSRKFQGCHRFPPTSSF